MKVFGQLWEVFWPWSQLNRELENAAENHGFARRTVSFHLDFGVLAVGFDIEIEVYAAE